MRAVCKGEFLLPLPPDEALALFTPEGERRWAGAEWDPQYAADPGREDGSAPGTVFTTESTGGDAVWIVVGRTADSVAYARVVPGRIAGIVAVTCSRADDDACRVHVTYDLTSLSPEGEAFVRELAEGYDAFLDDWRREIVASLARDA